MRELPLDYMPDQADEPRGSEILPARDLPEESQKQELAPLDFSYGMPEVPEPEETEASRGRIGQGLGNIWSGVKATPEVVGESVVGTVAYIPAIFAHMGRLGYGTVTGEDPEQTIAAAEDVSEAAFMAMRDAMYFGQTPEMSPTGDAAMQHLERVFSAPADYVFGPIGDMYGRLMNDQVAGKMSTDAMEFTFFFGALPKLASSARKARVRRGTNKAWENALARYKKKELRGRLRHEMMKEGKTRQEYMREASVRELFGEEAARKADIDAQRTAETRRLESAEARMERLRSEEHQARQKVYEKLFDEETVVEYLKDVEDFARRRDLGQEGPIRAAELEVRYEAWVERMKQRDLEFKKDWERWEARRRELDMNQIEPAPYDFLGEAAAIARTEGAGARTDLKFGIKTGRPWPQEPIQGRGVVTADQQPRQLREILGHTTDRTLGQKMALGTVKANRQRTRAATQKAQRGDPLASGKVKPVNEQPPVQTDPQFSALQNMAKEVLDTETGRQVQAAAATESPVSVQPKPIEPKQAKHITENAKARARGEAQLPKTQKDAAIEGMTQTEKVRLIKQRHELMKQAKEKKKLHDQIDTADLPADEAAFYRDMVAKDPEFVAEAMAERQGVKRTAVDRNLRVIDDMLDFMEEPRRTDAKLDSYFFDVMDEGTPRPMTDIMSDFNTFLGEKGAIDPFGKLSVAQKNAATRIAKDLQIIQRNAGRAGKTIAKYLEDLRIADPEVAAAIEKYSNDILNHDRPTLGEAPGVKGQTPKTRRKMTREEKTAKFGVDPESADAVNKYFDRQEALRKKQMRKKIKDAFQRTYEVLFARDAKVRKALEADVNPEAQMAMDGLIAVAGSSVKAKYHWASINKTVFNHLNRHERKGLNELVHAISEADIQRRRPKRRTPEGTSKEAYAKWLSEASKHLKKRHKLTDENIRRIEQSARDYFDSWDALREMKYQSGAIPEWFNNLLAENKYSPTRWMFMDHAYQHSTVAGKPMSMTRRPPATFEEFRATFGKEQPLPNESMGPRDTGIHRLRSGYESYKEMNAQQLLAEGVASTHGWVAKNEATKSLGRLADVHGEKSMLLRPGKIKDMAVDAGGVAYPIYKTPPKGFKAINWYEGGNRKTLYAPDWFANQWKTSGSEFRQKYAGIVRSLSLAPVTRFFATGPGNPLFWAYGTPMDIYYTYLRAQKKGPDGKWTSLYSINPAKFGYEMTRNLGLTAHDAFTRSGKFMDFVNEGGSFNAITEQGTALGPRRRGYAQQAHDNFHHYGSYLNVTSEYWVRLANREQYIKQGYTPKEATIRARDNLDYSQGGELVKFLDNAYPYTNVAFQAIRGLTDAAKKNPAEFAMKVGVISSIKAGLYWYNKLQHPESYEGISDYTKENFFILPTGFYLEDPVGNKRYVSIKQRMEPSIAPITSLATMAAAAMIGEDVDFERAFRGLRNSAPFITGSPVPPSIGAYMTYAYNRDLMTGEPVWRGPPAGTEEWDHERTSKLYRDFFTAMGMSPERGRAMVESVMTRDSLPAKLVSNTYDGMFGDLPQKDKETFIAKFMLDNWGKQFFAISSEPGRYRDVLDDLDQEESGRLMAQNRFLDSHLHKYYRENSGDFTPIREFMRTQPVEDRDRLNKRIEHYIQTMNLPYQDMWMMLGSARNERTKAEVFYQWWDDADPQKQREIEQGLSVLMQSDTGIIPKDMNTQFWQHYYKVRAEGIK